MIEASQSTFKVSIFADDKNVFLDFVNKRTLKYLYSIKIIFFKCWVKEYIRF